MSAGTILDEAFTALIALAINVVAVRSDWQVEGRPLPAPESAAG